MYLGKFGQCKCFVTYVGTPTYGGKCQLK
jgi:hypothetical protein